MRIYVTEVDVGRCPYAHITIERSLRHLCLGIYCVAQGMVDDITTSVPYSLKVHCTASIPELHRDLMWQDGYWAGSFCSCSLWFPINTLSLYISQGVQVGLGWQAGAEQVYADGPDWLAAPGRAGHAGVRVPQQQSGGRLERVWPIHQGRLGHAHLDQGRGTIERGKRALPPRHSLAHGGHV